MLVLCLWLAGCSHAPLTALPDALFRDPAFAAPTERIDAQDVFALSDEMRRFLAQDIAASLRAKGLQRGLVEALSTRGQLKLEYDSALTRNAAQAFAARSGNCLSLVIMTAAFARELGLQVQFQSAFIEEAWSRRGNMYFRSGHVNLTLGRALAERGAGRELSELTIDFLPPEQIRGLRTRAITREAVVSMYMNNRAAEALAQGHVDDAYWWAREAIAQSPGQLGAYNTLGVVYWRAGDTAQAEKVFAHVLAREPDNSGALANMAHLLEQLGRGEQAQALLQRLAQVEPVPPFHFFDLGLAAMKNGDYMAARDLFAKEVDRAGDYHEFHFWLGVANYRLGQFEKARKHLTLALQNSTTGSDHDLYAAKLAWMRSNRVRQ
jgi:tetratricopeptide (TPR) repeat protein